jgi:hypothetical protein
MKFINVIVVLVLILYACDHNAGKLPDAEAYKAEIDSWHTARLSRLKAPEGWLNLAGLYWLQEGLNTFGSDTANAIVFPKHAPSFIGVIERRGDSIWLRSVFIRFLVDSLPAGNMKLKDDSYPDPDVMTWDSLAWHVIKRGERFAIRLRDFNHPRINTLTSIPCFETDLKWRIEADYQPYEKPEKYKVQTVIGTEEESLVPGELTFKIRGRKCTLYPFASGDQLFIVFGDATNGNETYPSGRFLYSDIPDARNKVIIDFNRAYNPPCVFTTFATCPLPLSKNILPVKIKAGEKSVHLFKAVNN